MREISIRSVTIAFAVAIGLFAGNAAAAPASEEKTSLQDVQREMAESADKIRDYSADQMREAVRAGKSALQRLDEQIAELEKRIDTDWDRMSAAARQEAKSALKTLRGQRGEVAGWYDELKHSSASAWEITKKGFADAFDALRESVGEAKKEFGSEPQAESKPGTRI